MAARLTTIAKKIFHKQSDVYGRWEAVTPNDADTIEPPRGFIVITTAGDVTMKDDAGTSITLTVALDTVYKFSPKIIMATGTTAVGIIALY
jgi:hypothetical protein